jgi:hypothetical protein
MLLVLLTQGTYPQAGPSSYNIPTSVDKAIKALRGNYVISGRINPFYLRGDFDGDGKPDFAVLISNKDQNGIAICRSGSLTTIVLGAGIEFHKMKDLHFDAWQVYPKSPVKRGVGEGRPPTLSSEAILLTWEESASALIYWNGKRFVWYQQGD